MIQTMHHLTRARYILATLLAGMACTLSMAQYGDFGLAEQPADTAAVNDIIYYGDLMDMSGGYNVGDTVFDFTAYDFDGNPINLYDQLAGERPVVLVSGSVSCIRFRNVFDPLLPGQEVWAARTFIYDHQDDFNWIFIYGVEAHPTDGNCPSNCPPTINTDTAVVQPAIYSERRWAMHNWENSPEHDLPFTMYADNPDNSIYNNFFQRPFGLLALNCDGTVGIRADWVTSFFLDISNEEELMTFRQNYTSCQIIWEPEEGGDEEDEAEDDSTEDDTSDEEEGDDEDEAEDDSTEDDTSDEEEGDDEDEAEDDTSDDDTTGDDDDSDDDEPVDYDGPYHALEGHAGSGTASDLSEQASAAAALRVFPNPAQAVLTVVIDSQINSLQLTDLRGRTFAQWTSVDRFMTLPVTDYPRGQYVLIGRTRDGATTHRRVILH